MKKKHNGETPTHDTSAPYEVGYCKPPKHTRFQPGKSGNPKGRPRGHPNFSTILSDTLNEKISIREGDRTRKVSKGKAVVLQTVNRAAQGDPRQVQTLIQMMRATGLMEEEEKIEGPLSAEDKAIIAAYLSSFGVEADDDGVTEEPSDEAKPSANQSDDPSKGG